MSGNDKLKINITIADEKGNLFEGNATLHKIKAEKRKRTFQISNKKRSPSNAVLELHQEDFFSEEQTLSNVIKKLKQTGYNFGNSSIAMALKVDYLKRKGTPGKFRFIQKYPA